MRRRPVVFALPLALLALCACAPRLQDLGPLAETPTTPSLDDAGFTTADGVTLPVRRWLPDGEPSAVALALHGYNDYSNAFAAPGGWLAARGVAVYAYDQRGFGETPQRGIWPGTELMVADLKAMAGILRARHPDLPLYLLGDSMGGAVVMVAVSGAEPPPHDGLILAAPAVWGRPTMPGIQAGALDLAAHTLPWLPVDGRGFKRKPSDNVEMLQALGHDPLVIKESRMDAVYGLVNLMDAALDAAAHLDDRALILLGENEDIIPEESIEEMLRRLPAVGAERRRIAVYSGGYHMLLRDLQAETVLADIRHWIDDPEAPLPSGADRHGADRLAALKQAEGQGDSGPPP
jgi:alpha-beta hydrolase superfamily lysophospholipase